MKRLSEEIDEKTKFKKRKKGTTLGGFVRLDGQVKYAPEQLLPCVQPAPEQLLPCVKTKVRKCLLKLILNIGL
jgi:hypothetical protein